MNLVQATRLRIWYAVLVFPLGCATDRPQSIAETRPVTFQLTDEHNLVSEGPRPCAAAAIVASTPYQTEWPKSKLTQVGHSQESASTQEQSAGPIEEPPLEPEAEMLIADGSQTASEMTLEALEQLALANNPAVREASAAACQAMGIRTQVGLAPNPTVGYFGAQLGDAGTQQQGVFINQDFVLGDKLDLNRQVVSQEIQALLWEVEAQRYRVLTDVRSRFYEALAAQRRLELSQSFREVSSRGVQIAKDRMRALEGARPDILQSEIQLTEVDLITQRAQIDFEAAWRELASVAGVPHMAPPVLAGTLEGEYDSLDMESRYAELLGRSPELQAARARVQRARANLVRQQAQPIPNLQGQFAFGHDSGTGDELTNVQLGVPLPLFNKNQGNICAAQAELSRAIQNVQRLELSLRARLTRAKREYDVAHVTVNRYQGQILPKANENLSLTEEAYTAGEFNFLRVLVARRAYFDANLNYVRALADLAKADALIDGLLLSGGLTENVDFEGGDDLRGQALSGQLSQTRKSADQRRDIRPEIGSFGTAAC